MGSARMRARGPGRGRRCERACEVEAGDRKETGWREGRRAGQGSARLIFCASEDGILADEIF